MLLLLYYYYFPYILFLEILHMVHNKVLHPKNHRLVTLCVRILHEKIGEANLRQYFVQKDCRNLKSYKNIRF